MTGAQFEPETDTTMEAATDGKVRKSVLIPQDTLDAGQRRAAEEMRNFSNYVSWLIEQDVKRKAGEVRA